MKHTCSISLTEARFLTNFCFCTDQVLTIQSLETIICATRFEKILSAMILAGVGYRGELKGTNLSHRPVGLNSLNSLPFNIEI